MNNLLNYNDYLRKMESHVYDEMMNEGVIRKAINKAAIVKVRAELADEIEMSKGIMEGISEGLDKLSENFDTIRKDIEDDSNKELKGEKQKKLDEITKILEKSKQQTWDLKELIDEGEIDYAGFTADVGLASATYFGILLFPMRAGIIIHKGYRYFFNLIKNTIRKALVMLQLNYDQFQNLIIYQGFVSADYIQDMQRGEDISKNFALMWKEFFDPNTGSMRHAKDHVKIEKAFKAYEDKVKIDLEIDKRNRQGNNPYSAMDQYNNTYTKTLETLKQYSQEDVQKQLDAIKNSMNKFATGDVDLQAYGELIIASAEEHAYKVSSSIYNRFAKMSEVFSLPNQKNMIKLITDAEEEKQKEAAQARRDKEKDEKNKKNQEKYAKINEEGAKLFKDNGGKLGEIKDGKYENVTVDSKDWNYETFRKLKDDDQDLMKSWFEAHPEVLEKCDETLIVAIPKPGSTSEGYFEYLDALVSDFSDALVEKDDVVESNILSFNDFINESKKHHDKKKKFDKKKPSKPVSEPEDDDEEDGEEKDDTTKKTEKKYYVDLGELSGGNVGRVRNLFNSKNKDIAAVALECIGKNILDDKDFTINAKDISEFIIDSLDGEDDKKTPIKRFMYRILKNGIDKMKEERSRGYSNTVLKEESESGDASNKEKKSEK